jgi:hypothetical protein
MNVNDVVFHKRQLVMNETVNNIGVKAAADKENCFFFSKISNY